MDPRHSVAEYNARNAGQAIAMEEEPGRTVIFVTGSLTLKSSADLANVLSDALEALDPGDTLLLDLSGMNYIPSTGLGTFSSVMLQSRRKSVEFALRGVIPSVEAVFRILGLWDYFHIEAP
jgi:anti-anti-sigma factor